ncbi:hypothetical protein QFC24_007028 [Naganishia onofrii]|uniref:Uncharacterized protein n=1 Tax=Naganishia onofrii TaxID=1851511 RepID=A0ACC2WVZ0_9TREE|nr:hypothetical protein QFC24_007028 [Naganishia onofrii]
MSAPTKAALDAHFANPGWTKPHPPTDIGVPLPPIDNLPIVAGFQCTLQECGYITASQNSIRSHFQNKHKRTYDEEYVLNVNATKLVVGTPPIWISVSGEPGSAGRDDDTIGSSPVPSGRNSSQLEHLEADTIDGISTDLIKADPDQSRSSSPANQKRRATRRTSARVDFVKIKSEDSVESAPDNDQEDVSWAPASAPAPLLSSASADTRHSLRQGHESVQPLALAQPARRRGRPPKTAKRTATTVPTSAASSLAALASGTHDSPRQGPMLAVTVSSRQSTSAPEITVSSSSSFLKRRRSDSPDGHALHLGVLEGLATQVTTNKDMVVRVGRDEAGKLIVKMMKMGKSNFLGQIDSVRLTWPSDVDTQVDHDDGM